MGGVGGGGARGALRSLLRRSRRRRRSAAAAPAAILGSLCGGGDDPRLGCGTRLPSVSLAEPHAFPFSSLAFPPVRSPAGRLLTGGRDPPRTTGAEEPGGGRPLFPTCLHSHLWASASDTVSRGAWGGLGAYGLPRPLRPRLPGSACHLPDLDLRESGGWGRGGPGRAPGLPGKSLLAGRRGVPDRRAAGLGEGAGK